MAEPQIRFVLTESKAKLISELIQKRRQEIQTELKETHRFFCESYKIDLENELNALIEVDKTIPKPWLYRPEYLDYLEH